MNNNIQAQLSKINFILKRNPYIEKSKNYRKYIPEPYKAVLIISADFELAWAWRFSKNYKNPLKNAIENARKARNNIPKILKYCEKYNIPITWATVGHLFLKECKKKNDYPHENIKRLPYFENEFWKYNNGDWFDSDPASDYMQYPEWYAPDIIDMILKSEVEHEIGCHTFSHIDCSDSICPPDVMASELDECISLAKKKSIKLSSFVHPGHTIGNIEKLKDYGFNSYRTDYRNTLGYPEKDKYGLWFFKSTTEIGYRKAWSFEYHLFRYKEIIKRAIKYNKVCIFWFHPSLNFKFMDYIFLNLFKYIKSFNNLLIITQKEYIKLLERK